LIDNILPLPELLAADICIVRVRFVGHTELRQAFFVAPLLDKRDAVTAGTFGRSAAGDYGEDKQQCDDPRRT